MNILGICGGIRLGNWDAAAALIKDGSLISAVEEERLSRVKHAPGNLPTYAIRSCLKEGGIRIQDVDLVVFPGITYRNMVKRLADYFRFAHGHAPRIELCDHHEAHAAMAWHSSGFDQALVVTFDFSGDSLSTTLSEGNGERLASLQRWPFPQSLGLYYSIITQQLGFDWGEDEYKVMGLASYGKASMDLSWLLKSKSGGYELNPEIIRRAGADEPPLSLQEALFNEKLQEKLGPPRTKGVELNGAHQDLAASAQAHLEKVVIEMIRPYQAKTGLRKLCLAGGVAMNCSLNQKLAECGLFESVFVPPAAGDNGLALGAAMLAAHRHDSRTFSPLKTAAWGPSYNENQIQKALEEVHASYEKISDPASTAADWIARGKIIGWFQGRMEYGARALGCRSILADPRLPEMKGRVNAVVKFREGFRPFAPSVALEAADKFFEKTYESPFMTATFKVRKEFADKIPAVTHVDGTARIQTVNPEVEPLYHSLLTQLGEKTGIPMVLNTSFNIRGQPIVENPNQAISTFYGSGLDALVMGPFLLRKGK